MSCTILLRWLKQGSGQLSTKSLRQRAAYHGSRARRVAYPCHGGPSPAIHYEGPVFSHAGDFFDLTVIAQDAYGHTVTGQTSLVTPGDQTLFVTDGNGVMSSVMITVI